MSELMPEKQQENESKAELAFQVFCAFVFLSMIGLVLERDVAVCLQGEFCAE